MGVAWRTAFTGLSFFFFGLGSLLLGLMIIPAIHLIHRNRNEAQAASRSAVRASFRLFIWFMSSTGVLEYQISGNQNVPEGSLVVANHPSLIDVIFIMGFLPDTVCIVKDDLGTNLITRLVIRGTGFLTNQDPEYMITECVKHIANNGIVLLFPEGTRTVPGELPVFKRAAGNVITLAHCPTTPIFLNISPPTLAKGESWLRVPASKVRYSMEIGTQIPASALLSADTNDRMNARASTERLRQLFLSRLKDSDQSEVDDNDRRPAERNQKPDRQYS